MSEIPGDLKFMKSHEWARVEGDGKVTVGISDHAQGLLGDLVYVDLPAVGDRAETGTASAVVESVKAASDVYSPVSGTITAVNSALADKPETINEDALAKAGCLSSRSTSPTSSTTCSTRMPTPSCWKKTTTDGRHFRAPVAARNAMRRGAKAPRRIHFRHPFVARAGRRGAIGSFRALLPHRVALATRPQPVRIPCE